MMTLLMATSCIIGCCMSAPSAWAWNGDLSARSVVRPSRGAGSSALSFLPCGRRPATTTATWLPLAQQQQHQVGSSQRGSKALVVASPLFQRRSCAQQYPTVACSTRDASDNGRSSSSDPQQRRRRKRWLALLTVTAVAAVVFLVPRSAAAAEVAANLVAPLTESSASAAAARELVLNVAGTGAVAASVTAAAAASTPAAAAAAATGYAANPPITFLAVCSPVSLKAEIALTGRLVYAALIGAAVGKERSGQHHNAGVRTMALVALGAAAFTVCSMYGFAAAGKYDPSRMASSVASGVGFVGAGVITTTSNTVYGNGNGNDSQDCNEARQESVVHGLTTAAAIWLSAAIGVSCGVGLYFMATAAALLTITVLRYGRVAQKLQLPPPPPPLLHALLHPTKKVSFWISPLNSIIPNRRQKRQQQQDISSTSAEVPSTSQNPFDDYNSKPSKRKVFSSRDEEETIKYYSPVRRQQQPNKTPQKPIKVKSSNNNNGGSNSSNNSPIRVLVDLPPQDSSLLQGGEYLHDFTSNHDENAVIIPPPPIIVPPNPTSSSSPSSLSSDHPFSDKLEVVEHELEEQLLRTRGGGGSSGSGGNHNVTASNTMAP